MSYLVIVFNPVDMIVQDVNITKKTKIKKKKIKFSSSQKLSVYQGSFLFKLWEKPPLDVFIKVYVFNVTNVEAFLNGTDDKLKLQEVGPYVYQ